MIKAWLKSKISVLFPDLDFDVLTPPDMGMGDYSTNLAFMLANRRNTEETEGAEKIAKEVAEKLEEDQEFKKYFSKIEMAGGGFINFYLSGDFLRASVKEVLEKDDGYASSDIGKGKKINLEFVSANPTGPLTVGNARAASYGDTLGNILKQVGYEVTKEYYVNNVGVQVKKLAESVKLKMLELKGEKVEFSPDLYRGEYVKEIAKDFLERSVSENQILAKAIKSMTDSAKTTTQSMDIVFDEWFLESKLHESGEVKKVFSELESKGCVVENEGAKWLKMADGQTAVLIKSDGSTTYLMNDIAYTKNKFERGFDKAINIWGTDHHGDVPRLKAGVIALGYDADRLEILLHQLVMLKQKNPSTGSPRPELGMKAGQVLKMSKRAGNLVLLDDILADVGKDAVRFFFLTKDLNTHMEFDVELAKEQSKQNPVFYIQYAYARLNSIFEKINPPVGGQKSKIKEADPVLLKKDEELQLLRDLTKFPELVEDISQNYQVHHLAQYTFNLASDFHKFYEKHHVIQENDAELQSERLLLSRGVHTVLKICLNLMGLSALEKM